MIFRGVATFVAEDAEVDVEEATVAAAEVPAEADVAFAAADVEPQPCVGRRRTARHPPSS